MSTAAAGVGSASLAQSPWRWLASDTAARYTSRLLALALWQLSGMVFDRIPTPLATLNFIVLEFQEGALFYHTLVSMRRTAIALAMVPVIGIVVGFAMARWWPIRYLLTDLVLVGIALPAFIWALLGVMWWGFSNVAPIVVCVLSATPMLIVNTHEGAQAAPAMLKAMSDAYRVPLQRQFRMMVLPSMMEYIIEGFPFAFLAGSAAVLLVEWFGNDKGVGWRAHYWYDAGSFEGLMAWGVVMMVFIMAIDRLVIEPSSRTSVAGGSEAANGLGSRPLDGGRARGRQRCYRGDRMAKLVARGVKKVFAPTRAGQKPVTALNDVSFEVEGHTFVSVVGPSGCGKSTFLNIVSGVDHATGGSLDVTADDGKKATIGYVVQDPRLLPWQTVMNNMLYVQDDGGKDEQRTKAQHDLDLVGLGAAGGMYPGQLSGGMQQRVGIARALSIKPDLLLMDEPFSHLDAITARGLREELQRLWQTAGATVLFVAHDVMEAVQLSNRVLMMSSTGVIYRDLTIDLPYPRRQTDHAVAAQQVEILELFEVMEQRTAVQSASAG